MRNYRDSEKRPQGRTASPNVTAQHTEAFLMLPTNVPTESSGETRQTSISLYLGCGFLMATIFGIDLAIPLGVAMGVPYVSAILLSLWSPQKRFTFLVATILYCPHNSWTLLFTSRRGVVASYF
jgi:hypothetical protein